MQFIKRTFKQLTNVEVYEILKSRSMIFNMEQNIHYLDMDDIDYDSLHFFFVDNKKVVAYLRAYDIGNNTIKIGRVLTLVHGNGLGRKLMELSIDELRKDKNIKKIYIDAQKHAVGFYEKLGFRITTSDFLEEGIIHVGMELKL